MIHYVINMKRDTRRWDAMKHLPMKLERFEAIDGSDVKGSVSARANIYNGYKHSHLEIDSVGALGCAMSHIALWKRISTEPCVILEDDVILLEDYDRRLALAVASGYDLVMLGKQYGHATKGVETLVPWSRKGKLHNGSFAYYLTPVGAKLLLDNVFPVSMSNDHYMYGLFGVLDKPIGYIRAFDTRAFLNPSTIQHVPIGRNKWNYKNIIIVVLVMYILHLQTQC